MKPQDSHALIPETKIPRTILEFGEPLFAQFPEIPPIDVLRSTLKIVITVWNAHTLAMPIWGEPHHLDNMKQLLRGPDVPPWTDFVVAALTKRRHGRFADDPRAVGECTIEPDGCSACAPCGSPASGAEQLAWLALERRDPGREAGVVATGVVTPLGSRFPAGSTPIRPVRG